jgi:hypothetical protein
MRRSEKLRLARELLEMDPDSAIEAIADTIEDFPPKRSPSDGSLESAMARVKELEVEVERLKKYPGELYRGHDCKGAKK